VLVVQSYDPAVRFAEADRDMLTFVSHQIASALERKTAEARIEHLAYHDTLTGLPNRRLLLDRLELAVAQARRDESQIAVLFLDLDRFKVINDSLGHTIGDEVLQGVAVRLKAQTRKGDTVARVGGDEFTVVIRNVHHPVDTAKVAELIQAALREPLMAGGREIFVTGSIGISIYPTTAPTSRRSSRTRTRRCIGKGAGPRQLPFVRGLHERGGGPAAPPGERAAARAGPGRAVRPLPAGGGTSRPGRS